MNMKSARGWCCLAVFALACWIIGENRYLMKAQNATVLVMLAVAAGLVFLLNFGERDEKKTCVEIEEEV